MTDTIPGRNTLLCAVTKTGERVRLPHSYTWNGAQERWNALEGARRAGRVPNIDYFVVRSVKDPGWSTTREVSPSTSAEMFIIDPKHPKGFKDKKDAFKVVGQALGFYGKAGGWVYRKDKNGNERTAIQGWLSAGFNWQWERKGYVRKIDRRWYVRENITKA